ncbi:hypothetical protein NIES4101_53910 [Calothrix sp. NIES-4101]|nr:hypothetical protein NIES4101_53910 [Calothrix sp. NIES-4101]
MIDSTNHQEFSQIVEAANSFLEEKECPEFSVMGINWDDEKSQWVVSYYSDYSNHEFINVWVKKHDIQYFIVGHSFDELSIEI